MINIEKNYLLKSIPLTIIILVFNIEINAQNQVVPKERIDSIRTDAIEFLITEGYLDKQKRFVDHLKLLYFFELNHESILGYNEFGIYVFGVTISHTKRFALILHPTHWKIVRLENFTPLLKDMVDFLLANNIPDKEALKYITEITQVYEYNQKL